jgi:cell division septum initiation protein DivIVA
MTAMSPEANDTEALLLQVREIVETGRSMPMSASVLVNREEMLEFLDAVIEGLPEELRQARWLLKDRDEVLQKARREGDDVIAAAKAHAAKMVERTEVVREADRVARQRVDDADEAARQIRHEAEDYIDQKLASFEVVLERVMLAVQKGRERLQVIPEPRLPEGTEVMEPESAFFDQDDSQPA